MTLYLDRLNGVWQHDDTDTDPKGLHWTLVAKTNHWDHSTFVIGSTQNDVSVKFLEPFRMIDTGETYEFKPVFKAGDYAWVHESVLDSISDWNARDTTTGRVVVEFVYMDTNEVGKEYAVVTTQLKIPPESLVHYA